MRILLTASEDGGVEDDFFGCEMVVWMIFDFIFDGGLLVEKRYRMVV